MYSNVTKKCNLRLWEKYFTLCKLEMSTLNNRNELTTSCRHARKFLLNLCIDLSNALYKTYKIDAYSFSLKSSQLFQ